MKSFSLSMLALVMLLIASDDIHFMEGQIRFMRHVSQSSLIDLKLQEQISQIEASEKDVYYLKGRLSAFDECLHLIYEIDKDLEK